MESKDKLFFIAYRTANTLRPRWYLVQIGIEDSDKPKTTGKYHAIFSDVIQMTNKNQMISLGSGRIDMR